MGVWVSSNCDSDHQFLGEVIPILDCFDGFLHRVARFGQGIRLCAPTEDVRLQNLYLWAAEGTT